MTKGKNFNEMVDFPKLDPVNCQHFKDYNFRMVSCPTGELVLVPRLLLNDAYKDLSTWAIPIVLSVRDQ